MKKSPKTPKYPVGSDTHLSSFPCCSNDVQRPSQEILNVLKVGLDHIGPMSKMDQHVFCRVLERLAQIETETGLSQALLAAQKIARVLMTEGAEN